jgi:UDP-N-acetylmuramoyl-tripeptide--D-alanyl-D-alanine ligase
VLIQNGAVTIVNNTYSSNVQSFKEMIETAKNVNGKKVLVTPGIVELGSLEKEVHENLGKLSQNVFHKAILIGENNRTKSFAKGFTKNYIFIDDNRKDYFEKIEELKKVYDWIFLENDVTQNY